VPYPTHIEQKLEFDQIRNLLHQACLSELGQSYVNKIRFVNRFDTLEEMLLQTREFKALLQSDTPFPSEHYYPIGTYLERASIEGLYLQEDEWHQLRLFLETFKLVCSYFEERSETYPRLFGLFGGITIHTTIGKQVEKILDENGKLRPNASPELGKISSSIADKEKEIRRRVNQIFEKAQEKGYLAETGITIRDGRLVLPVLAEYKRHIPGFVHDESATGQTIYIEPTEAFDNNNLLRELQLAYRRERERILKELTARLRPDIPEIERYLNRLGLADFIRAKALLSIRLKAEMPLLARGPQLKLIQARHPLLQLSHEKTGNQIVPLDIEITSQKRIVVISGPNAGGKSVCLKTVGLLQYMLQCGLLIPSESHSIMGIFQDMMVDIGDEQSIENDLSTYSSHLRHMKFFTDTADSRTLFLIDEFGTGTDPQFGGPLAESILNQLNQKNACGVITTHYSNLKHFASNTKGIENACMLFDNQQMIPLYRLQMGKPGSSYAFEIAHKTGLNAKIIDYAKEKVGDKQKRLDDLLIELEREKQQVHELKLRVEKKEAEAKLSAESYSKLNMELEANKKKLIQDAKKEALSIITEANSRIENTIREIREKKAETEVIRKVRQDIRQDTELLKETLKPEVKPKSQEVIPAGTFAVGQTVTLQGQSEQGEIEEIQKNKALIAFSGFRSWVALNRLSPAQKTRVAGSKVSSAAVDINDKLKHFHTEINVIGMRGDEAMKNIQQYLDDAYLLGFKQVKIIHGRGFGILKKLIREYLKKSKQVESYNDEEMERGGDGSTVVNLKVD
jgi:DNA mismatch repair protein MutS2